MGNTSPNRYVVPTLFQASVSAGHLTSEVVQHWQNYLIRTGNVEQNTGFLLQKKKIWVKDTIDFKLIIGSANKRSFKWIVKWILFVFSLSWWGSSTLTIRRMVFSKRPREKSSLLLPWQVTGLSSHVNVNCTLCCYWERLGTSYLLPIFSPEYQLRVFISDTVNKVQKSSDISFGQIWDWYLPGNRYVICWLWD